MSDFIDLFSTHAGTAFAKKLAFSEYLGERDWKLDTDEGMVKFGDDLSFPVQILGTHSVNDNSWLWAWANSESDLPNSILTTSLEMKGYGEINNVQEFSQGHYALDCEAAQLAMICSGMTNCCYYRGDYEGGSVYFLVINTPEVSAVIDDDRVIHVFVEVLELYDINPVLFAKSFFSQQGFTLQEGDKTYTASRNGNDIVVYFDDQGLITEVNHLNSEEIEEAAVEKTPEPLKTAPGMPSFRLKKLGDDAEEEETPAVVDAGLEGTTADAITIKPPAADSSDDLISPLDTIVQASTSKLRVAGRPQLDQAELPEEPEPMEPSVNAMPSIPAPGQDKPSETKPKLGFKRDKPLVVEEDEIEEIAEKQERYSFVEKYFKLGNAFPVKTRAIFMGIAALFFIVGLFISYKTFIPNLVFAVAGFFAVRVISMQKSSLERLGLFPGRVIFTITFCAAFVVAPLFYKWWQEQGGEYIENIHHIEDLANKGQEAIKDAAKSVVENVEDNVVENTHIDSADLSTHEFKYADKMANDFHDATYLSGGGLLKMYMQYVFFMVAFMLIPFARARELLEVNCLEAENDGFGWRISRYFLVRLIKSCIITMIFVIGLKLSGGQTVLFICGAIFLLGILSKYGPVVGLIMCIPVVITQFKTGDGFNALIGLAVTGFIAILVESKIYYLFRCLPIKDKSIIPPSLSQPRKPKVIVVGGQSMVSRLMGLSGTLATVAFYGAVIFGAYKVYNIWDEHDGLKKEMVKAVKDSSGSKKKAAISRLKEIKDTNLYDRSVLMALTKACLKGGDFAAMVEAADEYSDFVIPEVDGSSLMSKGENYVRRFLSKPNSRERDYDAYVWVVKNFETIQPDSLGQDELLTIVKSLVELDEDNLKIYGMATKHFIAKGVGVDAVEWCLKGLKKEEDNLDLMKLLVRAHVANMDKDAASKALTNIATLKLWDSDSNDLNKLVRELK
jgi:predicted PurR-regulated permease PerM